MLIRNERPEDRSAIRMVHEQAFGRRGEADLVDRLREQAMLASFVAEVEGRIAGHILFSRISIETAGESIPAVALAPLAVLPKVRRQGIGGKLIVHGLDCLRGGIEQIVFVLGPPDYYQRFGFSADEARFIESPFNPKSFMALELKPNALDNIRGKVRYPEAFGL